MNTETQNIDTTYQRVIPRDLFNESKLLKCIGRLCLLIHDNLTPCKMSFNDDIDSFEIGLMDDGHLAIANLDIKIKGKVYLFKTQYNSKSNYPLLVEKDYCEYRVFDESGNWDDEFIDFCNSL